MTSIIKKIDLSKKNKERKEILITNKSDYFLIKHSRR